MFSSPLKWLLSSVGVPDTWGWHEIQHGGVPVLGNPLRLSVCLSVEGGEKGGCRKGPFSAVFLVKASVRAPLGNLLLEW